MLWIFWVIVALVGVLLVANGRRAFRHYLENRSLVWLSVYFFFLFLLGYLLLHATTRVLTIVQTIRELKQAQEI